MSRPSGYAPELVARVAELYAAGHTQIEVAEALGTTKRIVGRLMRVHGVPRRPAAKRNQSGEANPRWKGSAAGYSAMHGRVEAQRGRPRLCAACCTTDAPIYEWANLTGNYERVDDYVRLCVPCHRRIDASIRRQRALADQTDVSA